MFRKLLPFDKAKSIIEKNISRQPIGIEKVTLSNSHKRILAQDIISLNNIPPFNRSIVDGYAVKAEETFNASEENPVCLEYCGQVDIGKPPNIIIKKGMAAEIVTGAPIPKGSDSVIMIEYTTRKGNNVLVHRPVTINENVMAAGSDIRKNETVLKKNRFLGYKEIGIIAALGMKEVVVFKKPRVAVLSTGAEVVAPGELLTYGKIYDINAYALSAAVRESGGEPINMGIIPDKKNELIKSLRYALDTTDMVITSGGVSVGPKDFTPEIVDSLGNPGLLIHGVAVKPGKPFTFALIQKKPVFSLPGNPTSALFMFIIFVAPILVKLSGKSEEGLMRIKAITSEKFFSARGRRTFIMVNLGHDKNGKLIARPVPTGLSGAITTLAKANGFIEISDRQQFIEEGTEVDVFLFKSLNEISQNEP